ISFKQGSYFVTPVNVGEYIVYVSINSTNYTTDGEKSFIFTITQAQGTVTTAPEATQITYGGSLNEATINGGVVTYQTGDTTTVVSGTFTFISSEELGNVGTYNDISYVFTPTGYSGDTNSSNYALVYGTTTVEVIKATVAITVSNTIFEYGSYVEEPSVSFDTVDSLDVEFTYNGTGEGVVGLSDVAVGTYAYTVTISDKVTNYQGSATFIIEIYKKELEVYFVDAASLQAITKYSTTYNYSVTVDALIVDGSIASCDTGSEESIESLFRYYYINTTSGNSSSLVPTDVGEYEVYVSLEHANYYIDPTRVTISYDITSGTVESLSFESSSLSSQIYGSVTTPIVVTIPSDVQYTISYPGYTSMPTEAGTYSITVLVTDSNYTPIEYTSTFRISQKEITIEDIVVSNKVADGTSLLSISGSLNGLMVGDEVYLSMTAQTVGGAVAAGTHYVEILTWELSGLDASNYSVRTPSYTYTVKITEQSVVDSVSGSYATSSTGFSQTVTLSVATIDSSQNQTSWLSTFFGMNAIVQTVTVKDQGIETTLSETMKFYVKIPDEFIDSENLKVEAIGALSEETITFTREGDYITFYADKSGQIVFTSTDFPYWTIIVVAIIILIIVGTICVRLYMPVRKRKKVGRRILKIHQKSLNN
ncbi:MAG: MBG domain-containing protein, partial [Bacillota bacterium]